ncbi:MAG: transcription termination factor NusA [Elusimicrobiota bacterium]|nr:transcription termination factor NusA [Elusimicrobiota bacterium]
MKGQSDLMLALEQLEREKGIKKEEILKTVSDALVSALRKYFGKTAQIVAGIDPETGEMMGFLVKTIVEEVNTSDLEISLEEAEKLYSDVKLGEEIEIPVDIKDFSRIAAQTAKQVLIQKIREIEKSVLYEEFKPREGEIVTGLVHHIVGRDVFVDLGRAEGIMPYREQIRREHYSPNERIRAIIHQVEKENRGLQIILSRSSNQFLKVLFEAEVPEIAEKVIEIVDIVREPGFRAKVVVRTNSIKVDPVGACVGMRGSRIRMIMNELSGERIDLIPYTDDTQQMIMRSFAPATVVSVRVEDQAEKRATVIVPDDQLALSIGKDGNNIRLVSRLTGWNLEVKSEGQKQQEAKETSDSAVEDLTKVEGLGPKAADTLVKMGITDIEKLAGFKAEDLSSFHGIGEKTAQKIIEGAQKYVKDNLKEVENGSKKE